MALTFPMRDLDELATAYVDGCLSEHDTRELRDRLASSQWFAIQSQRAKRIKEPIISVLKEKYPNGAVVYLKGGSPRLIVDWCRDDGMIPVCWFDVDLHLCRDAFPPELLQSEPVG